MARPMARSASAPTLEAAKNHPHFKAPLGPNQGRGMAAGFWFNFGGQSCVSLNIADRRRPSGLSGGLAGYRRLPRVDVHDDRGGTRYPL